MTDSARHVIGSAEVALDRRAAAAHVNAVRDMMFEQMGETDGWCEIAALLLADRLTGIPDATLVFGNVGYGHHWWVRVDDLRIDPTADQFDGMADLPFVCKDRHKRTWYHTVHEYPITAADVAARLGNLASDTADFINEYEPLMNACAHHRATLSITDAHRGILLLAQDALADASCTASR